MLNVLMFITVYVTGFYASLFRNPAYAFVLYEIVYFFFPAGRWWGYMIPAISYSFFVVVLMVGVLILNYQQAKQNRLLQVPHFRWMYVVLIAYLCAYFVAVNPDDHWRFSVYYLKSIIIISIAYKLIDSDTKLDMALYGYIIGAWYIGFSAYQVGRNSGDRVEGIGTSAAPDANDIAAAIAPALVICLYYFWTSEKWWAKGLVVVAGVFIANGLVLINSRGAFLGAIIGISYFMLYMLTSPIQKKFQKSLAIFLMVVGLAGTATLVDETTMERFNSIFQESKLTEEEASGSTRVYFWIAAWEMAKDHPFGAGRLGFNYYAPYYLPEDLDTGTTSRNISIHSSWFEALTEAGYLGAFAFIMMIYGAFRALGQCKKKLRNSNQVDQYFKMVAIQAAIITFIIAMSFLNRMRAEVLCWLMLYAACAYNIYILKAQMALSKSQKDISVKLTK